MIAAENAIALQSERHRDGWGIAHYVGQFPHIIRNDKQALSDGLYREVSAVVSSRAFLAHLRRATVGEVNVLNCHPFQHGAWTFAHNGEIGGYSADADLQKAIGEMVDPRFRRHILGSTDSEVIFHVFLSQLARLVENIQDPGVTARHALVALRQTVDKIVAFAETDERACKLSFLLSNGRILIGYRRKIELFYSTHKTRCPERETCHAYEQLLCEREVTDGIVKHLIIASEVISGDNVWNELADGEYVCTDLGMNFHRGRLTD